MVILLNTIPVSDNNNARQYRVPEKEKNNKGNKKSNLFFFSFLIVELVNKNGLKITFEVVQNDTIWRLKAFFSNQSTAPMEQIVLRLAAPKVKKKDCH